MSDADNPIEPENLVAAAIEAAQDILDPLEGIVEKTATDPSAPFAADILERLAALKKDDRAAFEALRAQLKSAGCRVTALDEALAEENGDRGRRGPTQADILMDLAQSAELFHAPDGTGFADLDIQGHRETWPIRGKGFRRWLAASTSRRQLTYRSLFRLGGGLRCRRRGLRLGRWWRQPPLVRQMRELIKSRMRAMA